MASKHLKQNQDSSRLGPVFVGPLVVAAFVASTTMLAVNAIDSPPAAARGSTSAPTVEQPLSQEGRLVAVSPTSVTAESVDGFARTYVIDSQTSAITAGGYSIGGAGTIFSVNDQVAIVGVVRDGAAIATAVADRRVSNLNGPPMDAV